ncbi:MAG: hypothetical protein FWH17_01855 [Oscillospiraceae bacterium]|nr:hypothetical protein [Oscillospiraceae bacterium]
MTMQEKFAALTPLQREKLDELKDNAKMEAFLSENDIKLTDEEKTQILEFIESGKLPLSDEQLENVAGGGLVENVTKAVTRVVKIIQGGK